VCVSCTVMYCTAMYCIVQYLLWDASEELFYLVLAYSWAVRIFQRRVAGQGRVVL
jgi:hypothetical protein